MAVTGSTWLLRGIHTALSRKKSTLSGSPGTDLREGEIVVVTESIWLLQGQHGCYGVYIPLFPAKKSTLSGSPGTDLHEGKTVVVTESIWLLQGILSKTEWIIHSIHGVKKFHSLRSEFHSILTPVESENSLLNEWNLVRFTRYSLQKKWSLTSLPREWPQWQIEWKFTPFFFLESTGLRQGATRWHYFHIMPWSHLCVKPPRMSIVRQI